jgi:hypothetical protein
MFKTLKYLSYSSFFVIGRHKGSIMKCIKVENSANPLVVKEIFKMKTN